MHSLSNVPSRKFISQLLSLSVIVSGSAAAAALFIFPGALAYREWTRSVSDSVNLYENNDPWDSGEPPLLSSPKPSEATIPL